MDAVALVTLLVVLLVKEIGVPIPVPGDLLVITAGVAASGQGIIAVAVLIGILLAGYVGGSVQFVLVRGVMRERLLALFARMGVPRASLDRLADRLARHGSRGVAVARMTPGVRIGAIAASGLAALRFPVFAGGLVAGNAVFVGGHFLLGYAVGMPALELIGRAGGVLIGAAFLGILAVGGAIGWTRLRPSRRSPADGSGLPAWADAACPACLAVAAVSTARR